MFIFASLLAAVLSLGVVATDGDTLKMVDGTKLRLVDIQAPDYLKSLPCRERRSGYVCDDAKAKAAGDYLNRLIAGKAVRWTLVDADACVAGMQFGDRYGRAVVRAKVGGVDLSKAMIQAGHATRSACKPRTTKTTMQRVATNGG